jgi:saccharopine dehydrogenase (NAD+, L-lysine forming)
MSGKTCAGLWVTGTGRDGSPRQVYLYHVVDNEWSMREYGSQAVVWQTAINPVVALELLAAGTWKGTGVLGPEAFDAVPFLDLLTAYGSPWGMEDRTGRLRAATRRRGARPKRPPQPIARILLFFASCVSSARPSASRSGGM